MSFGSGLQQYQPVPAETGPKLILPSAAGKAFAEAMHDLAMFAERYGPLDRRPRVNTYKGLDILDHRFPNHPLNKVGIILIAVQKLRQAEDLLGQQFRANLSNAMTNSNKTPVDSFIEMLATPYHPPQQPAPETPLHNMGVKIHFTAVPLIHNNILVSQAYLQWLEFENNMFRRHLRDLEIAVADRLEQRIMEGLGDVVKRKGTKIPAVKTDIAAGR